MLSIAMLSGTTAHAVIIGGIDFPDGNASFADSVASFTPGTGPAAAFLSSANALGPPDVNTSNGLQCFLAPSTSNCLFTSLGNAGMLVLRFTDNALTGSAPAGSVTGVGDGINELFVFEVGVAESTSVEISKDGSSWTNVGNIGAGGGSTGVFSYGFDIDKFGFGISDVFTWVRITDLLIDPGTSPQGADIDAVGAIQTVPAPAALWLVPAGLLALSRWTRRRRG
jgi:hypothetical protein